MLSEFKNKEKVMATTSFLLNAFSLQMLQGNATVRFTEVSETEVFSVGHWEEWPWNDNGGVPTDAGTELFWVSDLESAIGHEDTARVLGVECNRINVTLKRGDVAYVAQLQGGRLPEGSTTLPEGYSFKFYKVEVL